MERLNIILKTILWSAFWTVLGLVTGSLFVIRAEAGITVTKDERSEALRHMKIFGPSRVQVFDFLNGEDGIAPGTHIECKYLVPERKLDGMTPKFDCETSGGEKLRVKYGIGNGELYGEVLSTRLLAALGLTVDRVYSVRVTCLGCPADPWKEKNGPFLESVEFKSAIVEKKAKGSKLEVNGRDGLSFRALKHIEDGATRAEIEALKLLAAMIRHVDSKPEQQAILCDKGETTCKNPRMFIDDLGYTFGGGYRLLESNGGKANLELWIQHGVFLNKEKCQAYLPGLINGTIHHPYIENAGRIFLAERLNQLSEQNIADLFRASRVQYGGRATVEAWTQAFVEKIQEINTIICPK